jgi:hypothetical protein
MPSNLSPEKPAGCLPPATVQSSVDATQREIQYQLYVTIDLTSQLMKVNSRQACCPANANYAYFPG